MLSSLELADKVIDAFKKDTRQSRKIRDILSTILQTNGLGPNSAIVEAERLSSSVLETLAQMRPQDLPFEFGRKDSTLLVGKGRIKPEDTEENVRARKTFTFVDEVHKAILAVDDCTFECLCAACLKLSGADDVYASCASDDGGIDIYGRLPLGESIASIDSKLLQTNILSGQKLLLLGQAKKYNSTKIGRAEIQSFLEAVNMCLNQYDGNALPPSHRVPFKYYRKNELCIPIFMTASDFSDRAEAAALSRNVVAVMGKQIAEFLCSRGFGFTQGNGTYQFDKKLFNEWLKKESGKVMRRY